MIMEQSIGGGATTANKNNLAKPVQDCVSMKIIDSIYIHNHGFITTNYNEGSLCCVWQDSKELVSAGQTSKINVARNNCCR